MNVIHNSRFLILGFLKMMAEISSVNIQVVGYKNERRIFENKKNMNMEDDFCSILTKIY
jgi:hypothetical protein